MAESVLDPGSLARELEAQGRDKLAELFGWEEGRSWFEPDVSPLARATSLEGWELLSTGAYFGYVRHPYRDTASFDVAMRMAGEVGVLTIPGTFFGDGQEDFLRFAFANAGRDVIAALPDRLTAL